MEVHKLKPIHSWRDFVKELGTIVLGIVIAISLEHLVQEWSWDREVKVARQALLAEIAANNENFYAHRIAIGPCVERDLNEAGVILSVLEKGEKVAGLKHFSPAPGAVTRDSDWQAERASQVLTHFPRSELALMSRYYSQMATAEGFAIAEGSAFRDLATLQNPPSGMTTSDFIQLRNSLRAAKAFEALVVSSSTRQLRTSAQLGVHPPSVDPVRVKNFCTMSQEDLIRWRSSQDLR